MPRKHGTPVTPCKCGAEAKCHYDVPNDEYFVECTECDNQGPRQFHEQQAKLVWTKRQIGTRSE